MPVEIRELHVRVAADGAATPVSAKWPDGPPTAHRNGAALAAELRRRGVGDGFSGKFYVSSATHMYSGRQAVEKLVAELRGAGFQSARYLVVEEPDPVAYEPWPVKFQGPSFKTDSDPVSVKFNPGGRGLIAHEMPHVLQQTGPRGGKGG